MSLSHLETITDPSSQLASYPLIVLCPFIPLISWYCTFDNSHSFSACTFYNDHLSFSYRNNTHSEGAANMTRTEFNQIRQERDLELAQIMATLYGVSLAQVQLWSI